jgi:IS30 family transposase
MIGDHHGRSNRRATLLARAVDAILGTHRALRKELTRYLRSGRAWRRPRGLSVMNGQGQLRGTVHISQRPAEASDRAVPGHWEGDLLYGKNPAPSPTSSSARAGS